MFDGETVIDEFGEGIDADAEMAVHEFRVDDVVAHRAIPPCLASTKSCKI
jgi:hypothetical protein